MREYWAWTSMLNRCLRANSKHTTKHYRAKGISVARIWQGPDGFDRFYAHIGPAPSELHTLDRIKGSLGYRPGNVRWATMKEQQRNKSSNLMIEAFGRVQCLSAWEEETGIYRRTIKQRLDLGWDPERALTEKPRPLRKRHV